jgi:hypothetical protein
MTTVAWDGKYLALDKQSTADGTRRLTTKARVAGGGSLSSPPKILSWAGCNAFGRVLADWYDAGADPAKWPEFQHEGEDHAALIIATARQVEVFTAGVAGHCDVIAVEDTPFYAWGSGYRFAMGAMASGKDAREAVQIAGRFDIYTSQDILWFPL